MHDIAYSAAHIEDGRNRLTALVRLLLLIPHAIVLMIYGLIAFLGVFIAWFALVITGRYPEGLYNFVAGYNRLYARVLSYGLLLNDDFPPFDGAAHTDYPAQLAIGPPKETYSRAKAFFRIVLYIPVYIFAYIHQLIYYVFGFIAWVVILVTGKLPSGIYTPLRASVAYTSKAMAYLTLISEDWPTFWTNEAEEAPDVAAINAGSTDQLPGGRPPAESDQLPGAGHSAQIRMED